jgi:hypothetical protein
MLLKGLKIYTVCNRLLFIKLILFFKTKELYELFKWALLDFVISTIIISRVFISLKAAYTDRKLGLEFLFDLTREYFILILEAHSDSHGQVGFF